MGASASTLVILYLLLSPSFVRAAPSVRSQLVALKKQAMAADYRADLGALGRVRAALAPLRADTEVGFLADYWSGYASWRIALNGANAAMKPEELESHLERAVGDFEVAIARKPDFVDAMSAAASVHGWLLTFHAGDAALRRHHAESSDQYLKRASQLDPANPRLSWVEGGNLLFRPARFGGNPEAAIEKYKAILAGAAQLDPASPWPDWGKAEAAMSLAYAYLNAADPDLNAAGEHARQALVLRPGWSYVRHVLMPQIEARRANSARTSDCK